MELHERMKLIREESGDTITACAQKIGVTRSAVSLIEGGKNKASNQTIEIFCREYGVNKGWLETGEGEMKKPPLDEVAAIVSDVLDVGEDDPFYHFVLDLLRSYQKLDAKSRQVIQRLIQETKDAHG